MIKNEELPIGFTMELAQHSDILNRFAQLPKQEQEDRRCCQITIGTTENRKKVIKM